MVDFRENRFNAGESWLEKRNRPKLYWSAPLLRWVGGRLYSNCVLSTFEVLSKNWLFLSNGWGYLGYQHCRGL